MPSKATMCNNTVQSILSALNKNEEAKKKKKKRPSLEIIILQ